MLLDSIPASRLALLGGATVDAQWVRIPACPPGNCAPLANRDCTEECFFVPLQRWCGGAVVEAGVRIRPAFPIILFITRTGRRGHRRTAEAHIAYCMCPDALLMRYDTLRCVVAGAVRQKGRCRTTWGLQSYGIGVLAVRCARVDDADWLADVLRTPFDSTIKEVVRR